ncbi:uncharacterized protein C1orf131 homolog isoform X1 [Anolis sagrei]|uniref:uncharacterized protein C1orf131 homolog isoform X1 n=1 Tax=Anolis sagrei TaxID=38937 RepID=UPI00351FB8B6
MARRTVEETEEGEQEPSASAARLLRGALDSLYDFGESLLNGNKKNKRKKKNSQEKFAMTSNNNQSEDKRVTLESGTAVSNKRKNDFFEELKNEWVSDFINKNNNATECRSPNTTTQKPAQQENASDIEVVTFHGRHRKKKVKLEAPEIDCSKEKTTYQEKHAGGQAFNLEKARLEVHQFGITGFDKKEQRVLEQERAIMLGAKPPKKEYLNYKILQEKIKQKKEAKKGESIMEKKPIFLKKRKKKGHEGSKPKKKAKQSIVPTGQVGTFKNGTLILRSSDIKKIKSSKVVK